MRSRTAKWASGSNFCASPSLRLSAGKSVSPKAVMAPNALRMSMATSATPSKWRDGRFSPPSRRGEPPAAHHTTSVNAPTNNMVLTRWKPTTTARVMEVSPATNSNKTRPAPKAPSKIVKPKLATAAFRTRCATGYARNAHTTCPMLKKPSMALVRRWLSSIHVSICSGRGITWPLQVGQCWPHPAPDPVARTYAPHIMTRTV